MYSSERLCGHFDGEEPSILSLSDQKAHKTHQSPIRDVGDRYSADVLSGLVSFVFIVIIMTDYLESKTLSVLVSARNGQFWKGWVHGYRMGKLLTFKLLMVGWFFPSSTNVDEVLRAWHKSFLYIYIYLYISGFGKIKTWNQICEPTRNLACITLQSNLLNSLR